MISDLFSQANFTINGSDTHPLLDRLNNPNPLQSKQDFLREYLFFKYAYGYVYQYPIKPEGIKEPSAIYNLNPKNINYNKEFSTRLIFEKDTVNEVKQKQFQYKEDQQALDLNIEDVIMFFDLANGLSKDFLLQAPSRLKSISKNIKNINTALTAESNALEKAGRFIVSSSSKGQAIPRPLSGDEKKSIERSFAGFGLGNKKGNVTVTTANLDATSLHVPMSQLAIPESVQANSMVIMNVFGVPRELYVLDKSGATHENMEKAMLNLIQNVVQNQADDFCNSYKAFFEIEGDFEASFDHLPSMQVVEDEKSDKALKLSTAIRNLTGTNIDPETFLETMGINLENDGKVN